MNKNQAVLGVTIIAVAVIILLSNINVVFARELASSWWPLLIVGVGLYILWNDRNNSTWGLIVTGAGIGLLVNTLGLFGLSFGDVFVPILLLAVGLAVLSSANRGQSSRSEQSSESEENVSAILGGVSSRNNSSEYKGGSINAVLGGADLDLSKATIQNESILRVWVLMGGVTLRVPEGVIVKQRTINILGGTEDKTVSVKDGQAPVLYVDGTITMGSMEIRH